MYMTSISYVLAGVQMPDVLNVCQGEIKLSWISTELYSKAAKLLARHEKGNKMYHREPSGDYYVLTTAGATKFKKVTDKLVERYVQLHIMHVSCMHTCIAYHIVS